MTNENKRPLRLAIVRQTYNPFGGAERFVERVLGALGENTVDVTLIARKWVGEALANRRLLRCNPFYIGRLWRDAGFCRAARDAIAAEKFDLVQSHERIPGCDIFRAGDGVHARWLELRGAITGPLGRLAMSLSPWHRYILRSERKMFQHPGLKAVICISEMVKRDVLAFFPIPEERLHVIYNGVDLGRFNPNLKAQHRAALRAKLGVPDQRAVFLYVGSGFERKGVGRLIEAAAMCQNQDAEFWIVGYDKHASHYEKLAQSRGLAARFRFVGPQSDVLPWLGAADAFVLPTLYEPLSNAVIEALAAGLPCVLTSTCGAAELVSAGVSGFVCDPLYKEQLAHHLDTLAVPGQAAAMSQAARAAVEHLGTEAMAARLTTLYGQITAQVARTEKR